METATAAVQQAQAACEQGSVGGCFAAGVPLLTPSGGKPIETFKEKDQLFARNESDPNGPPILSTVEKVFVRMAPIVEMRLEGQVIGTTAEHLFWVREKKAWTAAGDVRPGEHLLSHDGRWVVVEALEDTGRIETVYNLHVAECHTYFVGGLAWGFAVWAHNAYDASEFAANQAAYNAFREAAGLNNTPRYANCTSTRPCAATCPLRCPTDRRSLSAPPTE